jgi:hypothetical protein
MRGLAIAAVALALGACNAVADTKAAEQGVKDFHAAMDAGQYDPIYDASAPDMKSDLTKPEFAQFLGGLHGKLGAYKSGKTVGWHDNVDTGGHYVTLNRKVEFERGPATEEFVFRIEKGKTMLAGYHVSSRALVTS